MGGLTGSLSRHAENVYITWEKTLADPKEAAATFDTVLRRLVDEGSLRDARTGFARVPAEKASCETTDAARTFVAAFIEARLFITDIPASGRPFLTLAHEALLHPLRPSRSHRREHRRPAGRPRRACHSRTAAGRRAYGVARRRPHQPRGPPKNRRTITRPPLRRSHSPCNSSSRSPRLRLRGRPAVYVFGRWSVRAISLPHVATHLSRRRS